MTWRGDVEKVYGSTTLATSLAARAQREGFRSVLLADLDPLYGDVRVHLKLQPAYTFLDAFPNWTPLDQDLWRQLVVSSSGVDVLLAPEGAESSDFEWPSPVEFVDFVRMRYSIAFFDCPGLFNNWYTQLALEADSVFLVTTNELSAVHATKQSLEKLQTVRCEATKLKLVLNRYQPENGVTDRAIEIALNRTVFHALPTDNKAAEKAIFEGKPVGWDSRLGKGLDELWARLIRKTPTHKIKRSWYSRFSF